MHKIYFFDKGDLNIILVEEDHYEEIIEWLFEEGLSIWKDEWVE